MTKTMTLGLALGVAMTWSLTGCAVDADAEDDEAMGFTSDSIINGNANVSQDAAVLVRFNVTKPDGTKSPAVCTGSVVKARTVLTAAHCVKSGDGNTLTDHVVFFGDDSKDKKGINLRATRTVAHPKYDPKVFGAYDVAIVVLGQDAPVEPIAVARSFGDLTGKRVTHVGWGATAAKDGNRSGAGQARMSVRLPVTGQTPMLLQTGDGESGICSGDSGGPALVRSKGRDVIVGVHSFIRNGKDCLGLGFSVRTDAVYDFIAPYL